MEQATQKLIAKNANIVARRYKARCWYVDVEELEQTATCAQLVALETYDPARGPLIRYTWRTAVIAASMATKRASSPVSTSYGHEDNLLGTIRAPYSEVDQEERGEKSSAQLSQHTHDGLQVLIRHETAEDLVAQKERADIIRDRIARLLGPDGLLFAIDMLTKEYQPVDVAKEHGVPVVEVYRYMAKIRDVLIDDAELHRLWKEE